MTSSLYRDHALATFYDAAASKERKDFAFCVSLAEKARTVLDLGCGTGELAVALAGKPGGKNVVGVDPAKGMLALAAARKGGQNVEWLRGDARTVRLDRTFDLIILTGHAFQVFLEDEDRRACLTTIAAHLASGGVFAFDSRNPDFPGSKERTREQTETRFQHRELGAVKAWNISSYDAETRILTYSNHYTVLATGEEHSGTDRIAYTPQSELADLVEAAGLRVDHWLGDWDGSAFHATAYDIIPVGGLA
jgi:SAM-dependent methyltransferase